MFAPAHHAAMRHVGPSRVELGTRTIFNLLGPLSNPAGVKRQLVGVFSPNWVEPIAHVLKGLGAEHVWVVHGDGLDEMTTAGTTQVAAVHGADVRTFTIEPESLGLQRVGMADLKGGDAAHNAEALRDVLAGTKTPYRDIALLNAAAALVIAGKSPDLQSGLMLAAHSIDNGDALSALDRLVHVSNETN
jgi:anthranilate phosphoribosyltransferase